MRKPLNLIRRRKMDAKTLVESIVTGDEAAGEYFTATLSSRIAERLEVLKVAAASQMMGEEAEQMDELYAGKGSAYRNAAAARKLQARAVKKADAHRNTEGFNLYKGLMGKARQLKRADRARQADAKVNAPLAKLSDATKRKLGASKKFTPTLSKVDVRLSL